MMKKIIYVVIVIILIIAGVFAAKKIVSKEGTVNTSTNTTNTTSKNEVQNVECDDNNTVIEPEDENEPENNEPENKNNETKPEDEAKQIVEQNWGKDDTVYYSYDGIDESGRYIICVRDKATTRALYWYYVNVEDGSFDIK